MGFHLEEIGKGIKEIELKHFRYGDLVADVPCADLVLVRSPITENIQNQSRWLVFAFLISILKNHLILYQL